MTKRALMALLVIAKFEAGLADRTKWKLNVSAPMLASLRKSGLIDTDNVLTEAGWDVEGEHTHPDDGTWFVARV